MAEIGKLQLVSDVVEICDKGLGGLHPFPRAEVQPYVISRLIMAVNR